MLMEHNGITLHLGLHRPTGYCMWQGNAVSVVMKFMDGKLTAGHSFYTENFYSSYDLEHYVMVIKETSHK
jgi:hypothetical protein